MPNETANVYGAAFERHAAEVISEVRQKFTECVEQPFIGSLLTVYSAGVADGFQQGLESQQKKIVQLDDLLIRIRAKLDWVTTGDFEADAMVQEIINMIEEND